MSNQFLGFEDIVVKSKYAQKYKGVPGETHRIGIIWPYLSEKEKKKGVKKGPFETAFTHFFEDGTAKKTFICKDGYCCEKIGPPDQKFGCVIVKYKTKEN